MSSESEQIVDLAKFQPPASLPGAPFWKQVLWYFVNSLVFANSLFPFRSPKPWILRRFGATVGSGVVIHPGVNIKYPWKLEIGDSVWIGQKAWLDNLERLTIGNNVVISQGALVILGSHDYRREDFPTLALPVVLEEGCWIGARAIVTLGVRAGAHAVLTAGSVASRDMDAGWVYQGVPANRVRRRFSNSGAQTSR